MKSVIAIVTMISSVLAAFRDCGCLKAVTPFEIDSTPGERSRPGRERLQQHKDAEGAGARRDRVGDRRDWA